MRETQTLFDELERIVKEQDEQIESLHKQIEHLVAAARSLRELKPVAFIENHKAGQNLSWTQDDLPYAKATKLYALDEVTK